MPLILFIFAILFAQTYAYADGIDNAVSITEKECRKLIRIHSMAGADYVPGVDAHGHAVKGADLNGGNPIEIPKEITFDLGVDLAERYNLPAGVFAKTNLGKVTVNGQNVYWNGKKLNQTDQDAVLEACRQQYE